MEWDLSRVVPWKKCGTPAFGVSGVSDETRVVLLALYAGDDGAEPVPRVQPGTERVERAVIRRHGERGEFDCRLKKSPAMVKQGLFDHLVRTEQERLRNHQPQSLRGLEVDDQFKLGRLLDGEVTGLRAFQDLVHERRRPSK
jgi:hypothetical protein